MIPNLKSTRVAARTAVATATLAVLPLAACAPGTSSAEPSLSTTKLVVAGISPIDNPISVSFKVYLDELESQSNGALEIEWHPGAELVPTPEALSSLGDGVFDMLISNGTAYAGAVPLGTWQDLPLFPEDFSRSLNAVQNTRVLEILDEEYQAKTNTKLLQFRPISPYILVMGKGHEIRGVSDFQGKKIRSSGGSITEFLSAVGAVPVQLDTTELFTGLQTGVVDGLVLPAYTLKSYRLGELAGSITNIGPGSLVGQYVWMNLDKYNSLPQEIKDLIERTTEADAARQAEFWREVDRESSAYADGYGIESIDFSPSERTKLREILAPLIDRFVETNGAKAEELLAAYQAAAA